MKVNWPAVSACAAVAGLVITLQLKILSYVVSIEHRLTALETSTRPSSALAKGKI